jgi:peptidoglycan hydrolase-like protein with peptidoglycan-binding domain
MKRITICLLLIGAFAATAVAQAKKSDQAPSGTVVTKKSGHSTEVQPAKKGISVTPDLVRAAQEKLNAKGYTAGKPTGRMTVVTRRAVRKYQKDENLTVTGRLDEPTLSHLDVGAGKTMSSAPADIGRGAKAAGHDVVSGHPVAAAKAIGTGVGRAGKKVGEGTKSAVVGTKDKVQHKDDTSNPPPK